MTITLHNTYDDVKHLPLGTIVRHTGGPFQNTFYVKTGQSTYAYLGNQAEGLAERADKAVQSGVNNVSPFPFSDRSPLVEVVNPQHVIEAMMAQTHADKAAIERKSVAETRVHTLKRQLEQIEEFVKDPDGFIEAAIEDANG